MIICFSLEDAELFHSDAMSYEMELFRADRWSCIVNSNHSSASYEFTPCVVLRSEKRRQFLQEHKLWALKSDILYRKFSRQQSTSSISTSFFQFVKSTIIREDSQKFTPATKNHFAPTFPLFRGR